MKVDIHQVKSYLSVFQRQGLSVSDQDRSEVVAHYRRPLIMGILNVTPDSFSDGGQYANSNNALTHARDLIEAGADILDIGGESSQPNAAEVSEQEELARVVPVIRQIRQESTICISVDTYKPAVMRAAIAAGADIINDITGLRADDALSTVAELGVPVCLMHMQGTPQTMQEAPYYATSVVEAINQFFIEQSQRCMTKGIQRENLILDPGFGFGKTAAHNLLLLQQLERFAEHGFPLLLGVSRKSTLGLVVNKPVGERLIAGLTVAVLASLQGVAIMRTHDVDETRQVFAMMDAIA